MCTVLLFAPVPCRASIRSSLLMCSYHFHITSMLEAPYPLLALIICWHYGGWSCSSFSRSRHWGRPGCSSSPTVAGFSLLCFVPDFLAICYRSFRQFIYVLLVFLLPPLDVFTVSLPLFFGLLCSLLHICCLRPSMLLYFV